MTGGIILQDYTKMESILSPADNIEMLESHMFLEKIGYPWARGFN